MIEWISRNRVPSDAGTKSESIQSCERRRSLATELPASGRTRKASGKRERKWDSESMTSSADSSEFGGEFLGSRSVSSSSDVSAESWVEDEQLPVFAAECREFMKSFVRSVFEASELSQEEKARFGELCQHPAGRLWFARYINLQRVNGRRLSEQLFYRLIQFFAVVLFECNESEDFAPAKTLMNMCFTFYFQTSAKDTGQSEPRHYLYSFLRDQPLWTNMRFWNAAFFETVQAERFKRPAPPPEHSESPEEAAESELTFQRNVAFGQLGTLLCNMLALGLGKQAASDFLDKQATISNLSQEQVDMLSNNIDQYEKEK